MPLLSLRGVRHRSPRDTTAFFFWGGGGGGGGGGGETRLFYFKPGADMVFGLGGGGVSFEISGVCFRVGGR